MSIYATIFSLDHCEPEGAPYRYDGSSVRPWDETPRRGGAFQLAAIPGSIGTDDDDQDETVHPWLRLSMCDAGIFLGPSWGRRPVTTEVLLDSDQAAALRDALTYWLGLDTPGRRTP